MRRRVRVALAVMGEMIVTRHIEIGAITGKVGWGGNKPAASMCSIKYHHASPLNVFLNLQFMIRWELRNS